jgi:hypothetical protein
MAAKTKGVPPQTPRSNRVYSKKNHTRGILTTFCAEFKKQPELNLLSIKQTLYTAIECKFMLNINNLCMLFAKKNVFLNTTEVFD